MRFLELTQPAKSAFFSCLQWIKKSLLTCAESTEIWGELNPKSPSVLTSDWHAFFIASFLSVIGLISPTSTVAPHSAK